MRLFRSFSPKSRGIDQSESFLALVYDLNALSWSLTRRLVAFVGMKVADTVLRYFTNLHSPTPSSTAEPVLTGAKGKTKKPSPVKAQIGLQNYALAHSSPDSTGQGSLTYFYCLPSTSGRVAAYPVRLEVSLPRRCRTLTSPSE